MDERQFITDLFRQSAEVFREPPIYWKDIANYQRCHRDRALFEIDHGIPNSPPDGCTTGDRKVFSRMRLALESRGLIWITSTSQTSRSVCLTMAGLELAERLTGIRAPDDLRKATEKIDAEYSPAESSGDERAKALLRLIDRLKGGKR